MLPRAVPHSALEWCGEEVSARGVRERRFDVARPGRRVPGLVWTPEGASGARPLVLVCHGGSDHKRAAHVVALARRMVRHHGFAAAAVDGPVHGDRRPDRGEPPGLALAEFARLWAEDPSMVDEMVADWRAVLDALSTLDEVGDGPVGWWGLSMGTILGVPFVAAEHRIEAAVFGLMGTSAPNPVFRQRFLADARSIRVPVLFLLQWDDRLMRRQDVLDLFGEIASTDKRLHANPGDHVSVPAEELDMSEQFLAQRLRA